MTNMDWKTLSSEYLVQRPWLSARCDKVQLPDGRILDEWYVLEYPDWVNIVAVTKDGDIVLERQYRHGIGKTRFEIVAGTVEKGEKPLDAAKRELLEETGYSGGTWSELMTLSPNATSMNNMTHCFLAVGVERVAEQHLDPGEDIEVHLKSKKEVFEMLERGEFIQSLMVAPLYRYFMSLTKKPEW